MACDGPHVSSKSRTASESESLKTTESSNKRLALARERVSGLDELAERTMQRLHAMLQYVREYQRYCWPVESLDDFKLAPFHLLASEGSVHIDKTTHLAHGDDRKTLRG
jgi:protein phosphatase